MAQTIDKIDRQLNDKHTPYEHTPIWRGLVKFLEKCSENPFKCHLFKFKQKQHSSGLRSLLYWYQVQAHFRPNVIPYAIISVRAKGAGGGAVAPPEIFRSGKMAQIYVIRKRFSGKIQGFCPPKSGNFSGKQEKNSGKQVPPPQVRSCPYAYVCNDNFFQKSRFLEVWVR